MIMNSDHRLQWLQEKVALLERLVCRIYSQLLLLSTLLCTIHYVAVIQ